MITHSLSEREKQAIDAILAQAEAEYLQPDTDSIEKIDDQCRSLWPDWDPNSIRNKQEDTDKTSLELDDTFKNLKQPHTQVTFDILSNNKFENTQDSTEQPNDMNMLRKEAKNLMNRINQTVDVEEIPTDTEKTNASSKNQIKKKKRNQFLYNEDDINEAEKEETIIKKKKKGKKNSAYSSTCSTPPDSPEVQQSSIIRPKSKIQAKQVIASTSRQMKVIESENKMLKQRLTEMELSFNESQKEIRSLKEALRKSEAIRAKLTNSSTGKVNESKPLRPRKKLEYVNRF
ncbi:hypothetical protein M9Y10_027999 [Tritrichomonas musculus]|uniref:Uncharacterized protein n=1 Tax=Tritrichomonas musculus TaxID=1915356 RepID=A0ABR2KI39_9EUKA